jgi:hypothetical protein
VAKRSGAFMIRGFPWVGSIGFMKVLAFRWGTGRWMLGVNPDRIL